MRSNYTVAVIGAGTMGSGIAQKIAQCGMSVFLVDLDDRLAQAGVQRISDMLDQGVQRGIFSEEEKAATLGRVTATSRYEDLASVDLAIEAVFEDVLVKKDVFRALDRVCKPGAVLATNTSSFYVHEVASATRRPGQCVGLHYFFHPAKNRLLEIIPGPLTRPEVVADMKAFAIAHKKTAIFSADAPGFVVNRFFVPFLNEATRMLEEEFADIPTIEAACKQAFSTGMGPFELMNVTGVAIALHAARTLGLELGGFYEPSELLEIRGEDRELWPLEGDVDGARTQAVADRMWGVIYNVVGQIIDADVARPQDIDRGATIGLRWGEGPVERMNRLGMVAVVELCRPVLELHPDLELPTVFETMLGEEGSSFEFDLVEREDRAGVAWLTVTRPEALNALNPTVVAQLDQHLVQALEDRDVRGVALCGVGKAFIAGADIKFFIDCIEQDQIDRIRSFTQAGHVLCNRMENANKPVIAVVDGLALGGGAEVALAAQSILATSRARFSFPETGIGIYPGMGGTQRLPRLVGRELARHLIFTGAMLTAEDAATVGLVQLVSGDLREAVEERVAQGVRPKYGPRPVPGTPPWSHLVEVWLDQHVEDLLALKVPSSLGGEAEKLAEKAVGKLKRKAPLPLQRAEELIGLCLTLGLGQGLQAEIDGLTEIFSSEHALMGLKSVVGGPRPSYRG